MPDSNATVSAGVSPPRLLVPVSGQRTAAGARARPSRRSPGTRPLPDATCIYQITIPQAAPPYDDAAPEAALSLARLVPAAVLRPPAQARPIRASRQPSPALDQQPPAGAGLPPAGGTWPSKFAQVLAETLAGTRPAEQIAAWTTERARQRISQLGPLMATAHRPRIRRILAASPTSGVIEMTIIVGLGPQVRALAVRLERADQLTPDSQGQPGHPEGAAHWRCTAVDAA